KRSMTSVPRSSAQARTAPLSCTVCPTDTTPSSPRSSTSSTNESPSSGTSTARLGLMRASATATRSFAAPGSKSASSALPDSSPPNDSMRRGGAPKRPSFPSLTAVRLVVLRLDRDGLVRPRRVPAGGGDLHADVVGPAVLVLVLYGRVAREVRRPVAEVVAVLRDRRVRRRGRVHTHGRPLATPHRRADADRQLVEQPVERAVAELGRGCEPRAGREAAHHAAHSEGAERGST